MKISPPIINKGECTPCQYIFYKRLESRQCYFHNQMTLFVCLCVLQLTEQQYHAEPISYLTRMTRLIRRLPLLNAHSVVSK